MPQIARYLAFAKCTYEAAANTSGVQVCDCEKLSYGQNSIPSSSGNDKQKEITQKTAGWQYLEMQHWLYACAATAPRLSAFPFYCAVTCNGCANGVFHPPQV